MKGGHTEEVGVLGPAGREGCGLHPRDAWGTWSKSWYHCPEGEAVFPPHTSLLWGLLVAGTSGSQMEIPSRARLWEEPT